MPKNQGIVTGRVAMLQSPRFGSKQGSPALGTKRFEVCRECAIRAQPGVNFQPLAQPQQYLPCERSLWVSL